MQDLKPRLPAMLDDAALRFVERVGRRRGTFGPAARDISPNGETKPDGNDTRTKP
jgi:hypothetical protein